jgi:REP element-mobilizing transposase RayT
MYDPEKHHRRSVRLRGYDYSQPGEYFLTLCIEEMRTLFGRVLNGRMELNAFGEIADQEWRKSSTMRHELELDEWVVMPNHLHGIVRIVNRDDGIVGAQGLVPSPELGKSGVGAQGLVPLRPALHRPGGRRIPPRRPRSLASFVAGFKSAVKTRINEFRGTPRAPVWQENYHEHVIRNPHELEILRDYIRHNPLRWACDRYNPERGVLVQDDNGFLREWK